MDSTEKLKSVCNLVCREGPLVLLFEKPAEASFSQLEYILAELLVDRVSQELTTMPAKARRATVPSKIESHRPPVSILRVGQTQKRKRGGGGGKGARCAGRAGDSGGDGFVYRTAMRGGTVRRRRAASAVYPVVHIYYYSRFQQQPPHGIHHCHQACKQQGGAGDIGGGCTDLVSPPEPNPSASVRLPPPLLLLRLTE